MTMEMRAVNSTGAITTTSLRFDIPGMNVRPIFGFGGNLDPMEAKLLTPMSDDNKNLLRDKLKIQKRAQLVKRNRPQDMGMSSSYIGTSKDEKRTQPSQDRSGGEGKKTEKKDGKKRMKGKIEF
jgi:hypothetical protein